MRLLPRSLFGRTLLVLAAGLLVAQLASVVLNLFDRGSSVYRLAAYQIAARIAQNARILNSLPASEREKVVREIDGSYLRASLSQHRVAVETGFAELDRYEQAFLETLKRQLGAPWPVNVEITARPRGRGAMDESENAAGFEIWLARHFYYLLPDTFSLVAQVGLEDGTVAVFRAAIPQEPLSRLESLAPQLLLLIALCFGLAAALVYMMTRSLERLARAADAIGENPERPPLAEGGPGDVRRVITAFNRMQARVREHVLERTRLLGAISHDLKTPITRLRLRCEMLGDDELRAKMQRDLDEMETMVGSTLEFFRNLGREPERRPVDVAALVESLCEDRRETRQALAVRGTAAGPYSGNPQALRRCLDNLVENALRYGGGAVEIDIDDSRERLRIAVRDRGPGIPERELERVFEPYYRLDSSRNPARGGVGLGLSIARNIARWHGGDVTLRNASSGLVAELVLPRQS
jgi:signal transduction histidine kinase